MLLNLIRSVCLQTKWIEQLKDAAFDYYAHAEVVLNQNYVCLQETRTAELRPFVVNLLYLVFSFGQRVQVSMGKCIVEMFLYVCNLGRWLKNAYDLFPNFMIKNETKSLFFLKVIEC